MKKILLAAVAVLMAGMLAGCASTSGVSNTSKTSNKSSNAPFNGVYDESFGDVYDDVYWKEVENICPIQCDLNKVYQLKKTSDYDQQYRIQNTFNKIINSSEISGRDYFKLFWCQKFMKKDSSKNYYTLEDFLDEKETNSKDSVTGTITNNTDKILRIDFFLARYNQRHFYFEVPPHSEKEFKIPRFTELRESVFEVLDHNMSILMWVGIGNPEDKHGEIEYGIDFDLLDKYTSYLFDNYSFEMTFDENTTDYWRYNLDAWKLVPRYETEENVLTDALSYREIEAVFNKYR